MVCMYGMYGFIKQYDKMFIEHKLVSQLASPPSTTLQRMVSLVFLKYKTDRQKKT